MKLNNSKKNLFYTKIRGIYIISFFIYITQLTNCISSNISKSSVLYKKEQTAIVHGIGFFKEEAEIRAKELSKQAFSSYKVKDKICHQEFGYKTQTLYAIYRAGRGQSYWNCAYKISKK